MIDFHMTQDLCFFGPVGFCAQGAFLAIGPQRFQQGVSAGVGDQHVFHTDLLGAAEKRLQGGCVEQFGGIAEDQIVQLHHSCAVPVSPVLAVNFPAVLEGVANGQILVAVSVETVCRITFGIEQLVDGDQLFDACFVLEFRIRIAGAELRHWAVCDLNGIHIACIRRPADDSEGIDLAKAHTAEDQGQNEGCMDPVFLFEYPQAAA